MAVILFRLSCFVRLAGVTDGNPIASKAIYGEIAELIKTTVPLAS